LPHVFSPRYFSWTSADPHRSPFKLHTAALSVLCVLFQVQLSVVVNLSNVFPVQLPNVSVNILLPFRWLCCSLYNHTFPVPHPLYLNTQTPVLQCTLCFPFAAIPVRCYCHIYQYTYFLSSVYNHYICPIWIAAVSVYSP
jgi:hypothetical protein